MESTGILGVFRKNDKLFTQNPEPCTGIKVYSEHLVTENGKEFRSWNPFRSKLAAALLKGLTVRITPTDRILYLGAATGTTVSHISDIVTNGVVYAIENSPIAMTQLLSVSNLRRNIIPLLEDANHPERYRTFLPPVDMLYQDISQRNQADIFARNAAAFLKQNGMGLLMVKARSIDVALKPKQAYDLVCSQLTTSGFRILSMKELQPYEKDHAVIIAVWKTSSP